MIKYLLLDYGNTLARFYQPHEFPPILEKAISAAAAALASRGELRVNRAEALARARAETYEEPDFKARPIEERLTRVFDLQPPAQLNGAGKELLAEAIAAFMRPVLARQILYEDTLPALDALRAAGFTLALVSNCPWGSPREAWMEFIGREGLRDRLDALFFCRDAGWRKPSPKIYQFVMDQLGAHANECLFTGDDTRWDVDGPLQAGMKAAWLDRLAKGAEHTPAGAERITSLAELPALAARLNHSA